MVLLFSLAVIEYCIFAVIYWKIIGWNMRIRATWKRMFSSTPNHFGVSNILYLHLNILEDEPNLTSTFFKWVGSTTNFVSTVHKT